MATRLRAALAETASPRLGWPYRVAAGLAAAAVILATFAVLELVPFRSNVLYAAQLAFDHVRCFVVERWSTEVTAADHVERQYADQYGWHVDVPPSNEALGLKLVAARRCPFWVGEHAHVLYRIGDHEMSLYIDRDGERADAVLHVLGHDQTIWQRGGLSYALIARGVPADQLARVAAYLRSSDAGR